MELSTGCVQLGKEKGRETSTTATSKKPVDLPTVADPRRSISTVVIFMVGNYPDSGFVGAQ